MFVKDLLADPKPRGATDIKHQVSAVASSSSLDSARDFVSNIVASKQPEPSCAAYGSYEELAKDPNVDIIYVASPHSHHFQNCMLCLEHNKPVLCEKALTVNANQARILYETAKKKNLFFMEAVWTRYFPLSIAIRKHITNGDIGEVLRVVADLSMWNPPEDSFDVSHRMVNKHLAGGCLLDLGVYSLTWVFQTLYHTLPSSLRTAPRVVGAVMTPEPRTGVDEATTMLLEFPKSTPTGKSTSHAVATTALRVDYDSEKADHAVPAVRVFGEKGEIQVYGPIYRPSRFKLIVKADDKTDVKDQKFDFPGGYGMFWEADEVARCLHAKRIESETMSWSESLLIMEVMDEVRRQGGLAYPEAIESTKYPLELGAKS